MPKWKIVDLADAPEDLTDMSDDARDKLDMLRALTPGKAIEWPVEPDSQQGFKAAVTRMGRKHNIQVKVWTSPDNKIVCIRLLTEEEIVEEAAKKQKNTSA